MREAAKGQIVVLKSPKIGEVEALIDKAEPDRLKLLWIKAYDTQMSKLEEGDEVIAAVHTSAGVKKMKSMVINTGKEFFIESASAVSEPQNRAFVRASVKIRVFIKKDRRLMGATTLDLSGGGVKFELDSKEKLAVGDAFEIKLLEEDFLKNITLKAQVLKAFEGNIYATNFIQISEHDRDKIVRFCIKTIS